MISSPLWRYLLLALVTVGAIALKGWCELGLPFPPEDDAYRFLPQILHVREDGQAINPICAHPSGSYVFTHLTAALIPQPDYLSLALVLFGYQAVALIALALALVRLRPPDFSTAVAFAALILIATSVLSFGRSETLAQMWSALGLLAFVYARGRGRCVVVAVTLVLVFPTSWIAGILLGMAVAAYYFLRSPLPMTGVGSAMAFNLLGFALVATVPLLESSALRLYTDRGLDRAEAIFLLKQLMDEEPGRIDFTPALFTLAQPRGICLTGDDFLPDGSIRSQAEWVLIQQTRPHKSLPPEFRNYTLVRNYFGSYRPGYGSIRFAESPRVYNYAVYRRIDFRTPEPAQN